MIENDDDRWQDVLAVDLDGYAADIERAMQAMADRFVAQVELEAERSVSPDKPRRAGRQFPEPPTSATDR